MVDGEEQAELAERWRIAGLLLRRLNESAFEALLVAAEVVVVETPGPDEFITNVDLCS